MRINARSSQCVSLERHGTGANSRLWIDFVSNFLIDLASTPTDTVGSQIGWRSCCSFYGDTSTRFWPAAQHNSRPIKGCLEMGRC